MNCREALQKLYDYLDKELVDSEREKLEQHLEFCSDCLKKFNLEKSVQEAIKARLAQQHHDVEPLKARVLSELDKIDRGGPRGMAYLIVPIAAAAILAVFFLFPFSSMSQRAAVYQAAQLFADQHSACLEHLLSHEIESTDPHIVDSCMSALMEIPHELFEYNSPNIVINAGAVAHFPKGDEAHLEYSAFGEMVSLFINRNNSIDLEPFKKLQSGDKTMLVGTCNNYRYVIWRCEGVECIAVSKLPEEQLVQFASAF
ncbi:MAG: zf-HC2 domain-containing protein [bacterium]